MTFGFVLRARPHSRSGRYLLILTVAKGLVQAFYDANNTSYPCDIVIQESGHASQKTISSKLAG